MGTHESPTSALSHRHGPSIATYLICPGRAIAAKQIQEMRASSGERKLYAKREATEQKMSDVVLRDRRPAVQLAKPVKPTAVAGISNEGL